MHDSLEKINGIWKAAWNQWIDFLFRLKLFSYYYGNFQTCT